MGVQSIKRFGQITSGAIKEMLSGLSAPEGIRIKCPA
jgi:hypothetical protein